MYGITKEDGVTVVTYARIVHGLVISASESKGTRPFSPGPPADDAARYTSHQ